jgi:hypothetical protein
MVEFPDPADGNQAEAAALSEAASTAGGAAAAATGPQAPRLALDAGDGVRSMTDDPAIVALWISAGALLVSGASLIVAVQAKRQAKQTGTLKDRTEAINHLRDAFSDIARHGAITSKTVNSLREARQISLRVFGRRIRRELDKAHKTAYRLNMPPQDRKDQDIQDTQSLRNELQALLEQMNREAAL